MITFKIILCLICLILWILIQYAITKIIMTKVSNSTVRYDLIILSWLLEIVAFMCGAFLGLINC